MLKHFITILFCCLCFQLVTGQNLIVNPSFEDVNLCESEIPCSPKGWYSVSNMPYGYENETEWDFDRKRSISFLIYAQKRNFKTYWQTELLCPLRKDEEYAVKFYIYSSNGQIELSQIGFYFSNQLFFSKNDTILELNENLSRQEVRIVRAKRNWSEVTFFYKPEDTVRYLLIGNFQNIVQPAVRMSPYIKYYIDKISINPVKKQSCTEMKQNAELFYAATKRHSHVFSSSETKTSTEVQEGKETTVADTFSISMQVFDFDSYVIKDSLVLTEVLQKINEQTIDSIYFVGYTDNAGSVAYNENLSLQRAVAIKNFFGARLMLPESKLVAEGKGISTKYSNPALNRRVEIIIRREKE